MNIESTFTVLRQEQLLIDHAPHSAQFQSLTGNLLCAVSDAGAIPALTMEEIPELRECEAFPQEQAISMITGGACGVFNPLLLACFARHIGAITQAVYA